MTLRVVFRRAARQEFEDAALWYERQRRGLGRDFRAEAERVLALIAEGPQRYPRRHKDVRCGPLRRFPYSVFFTVEPQRIVVFAVFHARRDPMVWQSRT